MIIEAREDTITLRGDIKSNIWAAIQAAAALLLENHPTGIIIDASGVEKCNAKGAETFTDAFKYIRSHNARIVVSGLSQDIIELGKEVDGVRSQLPLANSVDEARASLMLEEITPERGKAREAGVVPIVGNWRRAVYHAEKLARGENCEIHLVDFIKVPLTIPIGTPQPEREKAGQKRLEEAKSVVGDRGPRCFNHVERIRNYASGVSQFVNNLPGNFAVISLDHVERGVPVFDESDAMTLIETANFEISLIKGGPEDFRAQPQKAIIPAIGAWEHALEHTCKLLVGGKSEVNVICFIEVPRSEPLDISKPDAEEVSAGQSRDAINIGKRYGITVTPLIQRVRDTVSAFMKMIDSQDCDLVCVGVKKSTQADYHVAHTIAAELLMESKCETIFLRVG